MREGEKNERRTKKRGKLKIIKRQLYYKYEYSKKGRKKAQMVRTMWRKERVNRERRKKGKERGR